MDDILKSDHDYRDVVLKFAKCLASSFSPGLRPPEINELSHPLWPKARAAFAAGAPNIIAVKLKLTGVGRPGPPTGCMG
jgi:hypothetical protein